MSNAFPSTDHDILEQVIGEVIPDMQDQLFLHQRHREAVIEVEAGGEKGFFQPTHGSGMGDGNA
eukprot:8271502-Pyramimonas_sp.AAC.1